MDIKVFLPDSLLHSSPCFLRGTYVSREDELNLYMTAQSKDIRELTDKGITSNCVYGRFGPSSNLPRKSCRSHVDVDAKELKILNLTIHSEQINVQDQNVIIIFYDYKTIRLAENWEPPDQSFRELQNLVTLNRTEEEKGIDEKKLGIVWSWLSTLYFCVQLKNFIEIIIWLFSVFRKYKKVTLKSGNMLTALLTDILIGYLILAYLDVQHQDYSDVIMDYIEVVVDYLRSLLKWLRGAPAGLKLNTAFNNMLGQFFLYHIELWWMFLDLTRGGLQIVSQLYFYFGFLGATFQAAIVSDMISFISFHTYCIYVYVARLFNIQVSGLAALLRLFVGRKRNPLRGGIDSCEYTNQQLFVGTVAFTILLFLLPTTAMYYIVFTLFRVLSLGVKGALSRLCYAVKTLPLYVCVLYLIGSPRIRGNIHMEVLRDAVGRLPLVLSVRLKPRPLGALVSISRPPPVPAVPPVKWTLLLANIFNGTID